MIRRNISKFRITTILVTALLLGCGLLFAPAYARDGSSGSGSGTSGDDSTTTSADNSTELRIKQEDRNAAVAKTRSAENETEAAEIQNKSDSTDDKLHRRAKVLEAEARKKSKTHSDEERAANCDARKAAIIAKLSRMVSTANSHKAKFDAILARAVTYHDNNNITSTSYDAALLAAQGAQAKAASSIESLSSTTPVIDCSNKEVASNIAVFKAAAEQARADLKIYRDSVKAVLESLRQ